MGTQSSYWVTLGTARILEIDREETTSQSVENLFWKSLWTCHKAHDKERKKRKNKEKKKEKEEKIKDEKKKKNIYIYIYMGIGNSAI
jgi:hypothetical protein